MNKITNTSLFTLAIFFALSVVAYAAWTGPSQSPPGGNAPAPLNVGDQDQVKSGRLGLFQGSGGASDIVFRAGFYDIPGQRGGSVRIDKDLVVFGDTLLGGPNGKVRRGLRVSAEEPGALPGDEVLISTDQNSPSIELRDNDGDTNGGPYIDFSNDAAVDWDVRIWNGNTGGQTRRNLGIIGPPGNFTAVRLGIGMSDPTRILEIVGGKRPIADGWDINSSIRLKENIKPIENALDKVMKLNGVYFDWKESKQHDIGFIAEEAGKIIPEIVTYEENGKDAQSMDYSRLSALLVEAMKEQQTQIQALEQEIKNLKDQIKAK